MNTSKSAKCRNIQLHLVEYVQRKAGTLNSRIVNHLSNCEQCREWEHFIRLVQEATPEYSTESSFSFSDKMAQVVEHAERRATPRQWGYRLTGVAAAALILVISIFGEIAPDLDILVSWIGRIGWYRIGFAAMITTCIFFLISTPLLILRPRQAKEPIR